VNVTVRPPPKPPKKRKHGHKTFSATAEARAGSIDLRFHPGRHFTEISPEGDVLSETYDERKMCWFNMFDRFMAYVPGDRDAELIALIEISFITRRGYTAEARVLAGELPADGSFDLMLEPVALPPKQACTLDLAPWLPG
jgi:hypothetical protein